MHWVLHPHIRGIRVLLVAHIKKEREQFIPSRVGELPFKADGNEPIKCALFGVREVSAWNREAGSRR